MNNGLRLVARIGGLLAVYYVLQVLFLTLATSLLVNIASNAGDIPADAIDFINNTKYLNDTLQCRIA